jgi:hypothetical protein
VLWQDRLAKLQGVYGSGPSTGPSAMLRPVPLAKPILPPIARYAKTVFPLSLPPLEAHMPPLASKLASMSPWAAPPRPRSPSPALSRGLHSSPSSPTAHGTSVSVSSSSSNSAGAVWETTHTPSVQEVRESVKVGWERRLKRRRSFRRASVDHSGRRLGPVAAGAVGSVPVPTVVATNV